MPKMKLDVVAICAGLLHDTVEDTTANLSDIEEMFGAEVSKIVDGVTKISQIEFRQREKQQAETIRKMIVAMATDIRVLLVKIADRLHNMRTLGYHARGTPAPNRQGNPGHLRAPGGPAGSGKKEVGTGRPRLLSIWSPTSIGKSGPGMAQKQEEQRKYYSTKSRTSSRISCWGTSIKGRVKGRLKHMYSIYQKMVKQSLALDQVYDLMAFRIIVQTVRDCYATLGVIHQKWTPIPGRFKDYIAMPKSNMYQSLHTTVLGP